MVASIEKSLLMVSPRPFKRSFGRSFPFLPSTHTERKMIYRQVSGHSFVRLSLAIGIEGDLNMFGFVGRIIYALRIPLLTGIRRVEEEAMFGQCPERIGSWPRYLWTPANSGQAGKRQDRTFICPPPPFSSRRSG